MPRMTAKYKSATELARRWPGAAIYGDQEALYAALQEQGFFWDSAKKRWDEHDIELADEPTRLILLRVWADEEIAEEAADDVIRSTAKFFELIERSTPYRCRPPKQREVRIYLKFLPKKGKQS